MGDLSSEMAAGVTHFPFLPREHGTMDRLLTAKQVGELLNVRAYTIYEWVKGR
jgi:hypothetical protein